MTETALAEAGGLESAAPGVSSSTRLPALDGLRGLAALAVLTTHVGFQSGRSAQPGPVGAVLARLDFGVTVFFLLSGFLLFRPFLPQAGRRPTTPNLRTYARRRAGRVLPAYWLAVVLALLVMPRSTGSSTAGPGEWLRQLSLTQVYGDRGAHLLPGLTQMWSLSVEVAFYALLPVLGVGLALAHARRPHRHLDAILLAGLIVIGLGWTALSSGWSAMPATAHLWLPGYLDWFALGMAGALLQARGTGTVRRVCGELAQAPGTCWTVAVLLFLLAATPLGGPRLLDAPTGWEALVKHALYGASAALLLVPVVFGGRRASTTVGLLTRAPLQWLGKISYSVFVVHLVILQLVFNVTGWEPFTGHALPLWCATLAVTLAVSAVTYRLVELPAQRWVHPRAVTA